MERKRSSRRNYTRPPEKSFGTKCKDFLRQFVAFMFSNVGIIGLVVGYTIAGAFIFQAIEGQQPKQYVNKAVTQLRNDTANILWNITCTLNAVLDYEDIEEVFMIEVAMVMAQYQSDVVEAISDGWDGSEAGSLQWSFPSSFLYSLTVITTIGYGNVTPQTEWGKVATIFYAIAGMPLFLLYLSNIGDILARSFKWLYARCCLCKCCPKKRKTQPPTPLPATRALPVTLTPSSGTKLHRGNSDRGFSPRLSMVPSRLQGSLSMEDGVNIQRGRQELDGFGRNFRDGYRRSIDVNQEEGYGEDDCDDDVYGSQDVHMNRANAQVMRRLNEFEKDSARLSGSFGDVVLSELKRGGSETYRRNLSSPAGGMVRSGSVSGLEGGARTAGRGTLRRQEEVMEMSDMGGGHPDVHRLERGGSERMHMGRGRQEGGMTKAELVLGMNDLGLEYLDLPKKKGRLQRVFGKSEGRLNRPDPDYVMRLGMKDTSRFEEFPRGAGGGSERAIYRQDTKRIEGPIRTSSMIRPSNGLNRSVSAGRMDPIHTEVVTSDEDATEDGSQGTEESEEFDSQTVTVPVTLCLTIMVGYVVGGALLFSAYEQWDMLDGSYFCFISLSTIGFGDLVPGKTIIEGSEGIELSFIFCSMYLMLGMALIAMCFNLMQEEVVHKMRSLVAGLKNCLSCVKRSILPSS